MHDVIDRVPFSKTQIYRKIADGTFPRPVPLGPHRVAWLESEIDAWVAERLAARDALKGLEERRLRASRRAMGARKP
ncbi:AlpA family phage regulatory protein [Mesorhizobium sp. LjNodule214]